MTPDADPHASMPYRLNAGAVLFNRSQRVFVGRRADRPPGEPGAWQLPQGGIEQGEDPAAAVVRELAEEIGTTQVEIVGEHPDWLTYELPADLIGHALRGRYRGQRQRWFALQFTGSDRDIHLDNGSPVEFDAWRWVDLTELEALAVPFRRPIYRILAKSFARFAASMPITE